jgi:hypothetical protein
MISLVLYSRFATRAMKWCIFPLRTHSRNSGYVGGFVLLYNSQCHYDSMYFPITLDGNVRLAPFDWN